MRHSDILDAWEITAPLKSLRVLKKPDVLLSLPPIYLSKPPGRDEKPARRGSKKHGAVYYHVIKHGFSPREGNLPTHDALAGYVFRVGSGDSVLESAAAAQRIAERMDTQASLHVRLGGDNPARPQDDEAWTCQRALEATVCAYVFPRLHVFIDTLTDVERGYFPRLGVLDALCNPRRGFHAIRNLNALLQQSDTGRPRPAWRLCHKTYAAHRLILLQRRDSAERVVITPPGVAVSPALSQAAVTPTQVYDLIEGERYSADGPAPAHNPLLIRATAAAP